MFEIVAGRKYQAKKGKKVAIVIEYHRRTVFLSSGERLHQDEFWAKYVPEGEG